MRTHLLVGVCSLVLLSTHCCVGQTAGTKQKNQQIESDTAVPIETPRQDNDPLERVINSMRASQKRIENRDTGRETRDIQSQIVEDLQKLIDQARRQRQSNRQQQNRPNQESRKPPSEDKQNSPQRKDQQNPDTPKPQPDNQEEGEDSNERVDQAQPTDVELAQRKAMVQQVWGHLPPTLRSKMLNIFSEESLPKYRDLVRHYFKSLGEPKHARR